MGSRQKVYFKGTIEGVANLDYIKGLTKTLNVRSVPRQKVVRYLLEHLLLNNNVFHVTIRELAELTGVSKNTVIFTLQTLEEGRIIKRRRSTIILNFDALERSCTPDRRTSSSERYEFDFEVPKPREEFCCGNRTVKPDKEQEREMAFMNMVQKKNTDTISEWSRKLEERERALNERERAVQRREVSLLKKEKHLIAWNQRLDECLGLRV